MKDCSRKKKNKGRISALFEQSEKKAFYNHRKHESSKFIFIFSMMRCIVHLI